MFDLMVPFVVRRIMDVAIPQGDTAGIWRLCGLLVLFAVLIFLRRKVVAFPGVLSGVYLVGYAILRFGMEYLRGDPRAAVGPFSISQTISLGMMVLGGMLIAYGKCARHHR